MGKIKEKLFDFAEMVSDIMKTGISDIEVDSYMEAQLMPEDYQMYQSHKDIVMDMLGIDTMDESILMPRLNTIQESLKIEGHTYTPIKIGRDVLYIGSDGILGRGDVHISWDIIEKFKNKF